MSKRACEELVTAASELAQNALDHANGGEILLGTTIAAGRPAIVVVAQDRGPGILDLESALRDGFSTGRGLGLGLPSARRLVDSFEIESRPGCGTTVTIVKFLTPDESR